MSDLALLSHPSLPRTVEPYRVAIRRLRWFRAALVHQLASLSVQTGVVYEVDDRKLAAAFVAWLRRVEEQKPDHPEHRRAFFDFAAGVMLEELLSKMPLREKAPAAPPEEAGPEHVWPEGFACTIFCINMLAAVLAQEYDEPPAVAPDFFDARVWTSFQENVQEQGSRAIGFLHLFVGATPDWVTPTLFRWRLGAAGAFQSAAVSPSLVSSLS